MKPSSSRRHFFERSMGAFAGLAILPRGVRAAEFEWKYGIEQGPDDPMVVRTVQAFDKIRDETGGRLDIKSFPNSALGGTTAMLTQLRAGALEVLGFAGTSLDILVPISGITGLGFAFKDSAEAFAAFDGDLGRLIRKEILAKDIMTVGPVFSPGFINLFLATKPIRNAEDLGGVKIRVAPSKMNVDLVRSMGAAVVPMASNEVFTALTTHLIEGESTSFSALMSIGWAPAVKYASLTNHMWNCYWTLINQAKWQSLPANVQAIVEKRFDEAVRGQRRDAAQRDRSVSDKLERLGIAFNTPDRGSFKPKLQAAGYYARWKEEFGPAAWAALTRYVDLS